MSKKFATLGSLGKDDRDSGEESDGGGERQSFYVGGSEHSGQQVLGPDRPNRGNPSNIAERVFDAARQHGAEVLNTSSEPAQSHARPRFRGGGVRLGDSSSSPHIPADDTSSGESDSNHSDDVVVYVYMWKNGFSVEDGPLRNFDDPQNQPFIESITQGRIPAEILAAHPRRRIDLRMQRKDGFYEPPKLKPFQGTGVRLGAVVPQVVSSNAASSSSTVAPPAPVKGCLDSDDNVAKAQTGVNLDSDSPITQVQIRLPNGQRVSGKFNHSHSVFAVRNFLATAHPEIAATEFQLMTTFPNKVIDDESVSLKDAGLLNAVVVVKLCPQ